MFPPSDSNTGSIRDATFSTSRENSLNPLELRMLYILHKISYFILHVGQEK
jgi:hypothetical protein